MSSSVVQQHQCDENVENQPSAPKKQKTDASDDDGTKAKTVARFAVSSIRSHGKSVVSNYTVDLLVAEYSLYELVSIIIEDIMYKREKVTEDCVYSHIWSLQFQGKSYRYFGYESTIDDRSPIALSSIDLKKGGKGAFRGETGTFDFEVMSLEIEKTKGGSSSAYPCIKPVPPTVSSTLSDDWLDEAEKAQVEELRNKWDVHFKNPTVWKGSYVRGFKKAKPTAPRWDNQELELMAYLIHAGCKFQKSWNLVLKYALPHRAQAASSGQWYKLIKEDYRLKHYGTSGKTMEDKVRLAKLQAQNQMKGALSRGVPEDSDVNPQEEAIEHWRRKGKPESELQDPSRRHDLMWAYQDMVMDMDDDLY